MNDQDKEAFENWYQEYFKISGITILNIPHHFTEAWQSACEYKQKEIDELEKEKDYLCRKMENMRNIYKQAD